MASGKEIEILDISQKKTVRCSECGLTSEIPPRIISMESLRHMQVNQWFANWRQKHIRDKDVHGLGNVRLLICPRCQHIAIGTDEFTIRG